VNNNNWGSFGAVDVEQPEETCQMEDTVVMKSIHAVCVTEQGREFAATHMVPDTWIDSSYEGEILRCIAGAKLKILVGDVVQSDQGMAATYGNGQVLACAPGEAVRHFKGGMLKCAPATRVPDCTERSNLRRYGSGDLFFTFRTKACVSQSKMSSRSSANYSRRVQREEESYELPTEGGVGGGSDY